MKARHVLVAVLLPVAISSVAGQSRDAPNDRRARPTLEIYGQLITDVIHDFDQNDPFWFDVMRPSKLPAFTDEFGKNGRQHFSARSTTFGVKPVWPTSRGEIRGVFEFDLFGPGGRPGFDLALAYAELGKFGAGQFYSPFMDIDVFPNILDYWGPVALVYYRNIQVRYMPVQGESRVTLAFERPGASGDRGDFDDRVELQNVVGRFPWPDFSAEGRLARQWGYIELAGILRGIYWDDLLRDDAFDLAGSALGWGLSLSSNIKAAKSDVLKLQVTYGEAIQSYLDAPAEIGIELNPGNPLRPLIGVALPAFGFVAFYDRSWSERLTSSLGYSRLRIVNSDGQSTAAYRIGQYAIVNLLYYPVEQAMVGAEVQWGRRENAFDGFGVNDVRLLLSARYAFSFTIRGDGNTDDR